METRVLTLPMWELATSGTVYDMLVGHEVGHALYTPDKWDFLGKIPKAFVNVTEDASIEKLMKVGTLVYPRPSTVVTLN